MQAPALSPTSASDMLKVRDYTVSRHNLEPRRCLLSSRRDIVCLSIFTPVPHSQNRITELETEVEMLRITSGKKDAEVQFPRAMNSSGGSCRGQRSVSPLMWVPQE